jgi:UDP-N-acetylmuramyl pentapeptide synthase
MLNEYKKPMWNDGYAKDMPWLNYFNEYERMHCCFDGDGENGESGGKGDNTISAREEEDKALGEVSAANAAAAAAAAAAASASTETTVLVLRESQPQDMRDRVDNLEK